MLKETLTTPVNEYLEHLLYLNKNHMEFPLGCYPFQLNGSFIASEKAKSNAMSGVRSVKIILVHYAIE